MGETKRYYENGQWHDYESVWDGKELLPPYDTPGGAGVTAKMIDVLEHTTRTRSEKRAPKDSYRLVGRLRRKGKAA